MFHHMLNTSAIWIISLGIFDLFLKKENFHTYNRIYLLFTFLLGIWLPFWTWTSNNPVFHSSLGKPIQQAAFIRQTISTNTVNIAPAYNWQLCLLFLYFLGFIIGLIWLIREVILLAKLYRNGKKSNDAHWVIIETAKQHAPFSIFHYLFVNSKAQYNNSEWNMICKHEAKHAALLHFIDIFIMQIARIVFWFHPFVYSYHKRLLLIHEYQADAINDTAISIYGQFLIEQALLQPAPSLSHSFNRSPIKSRIMMLTHQTKSRKHFSKLMVLPLLAVSLICCTKSMYSGSDRPQRNGRAGTYRGNTFTFSAPDKPRTLTISINNGSTLQAEPATLQMKDSLPTSMNGKPIYDYFSTKPAATYRGVQINIIDYLLVNLNNQISSLIDGAYTIVLNNMVVDENGKIVYYEYLGLQKNKDYVPNQINAAADMANHPLPANGTLKLKFNGNPKPAVDPSDIDQLTQQKIADKLYPLMTTAPACKPAEIDGKNVISMLCNILPGTRYLVSFHVTNHQVVSDMDFMKS